MNLKRTLIEIKGDGKTFYILGLPNSKCFNFLVRCNMGGNSEEKFKKLTQRNIFGLSHLVEHLSFKSPKDYTTDDFIKELRDKGIYNAMTNNNYIMYYHQSIMEHYKTSVDLVLNAALNDLSRVTEEEFVIERKVVSNEAKMYNSNVDNKFRRNAARQLTGQHIENDVIGLSETIDNFSLEDAKELKANFLNYSDTSYHITYDPLEMEIGVITKYILSKLNEFKKPKVFVNLYESYRKDIKKYSLKNTVEKIESKSTQAQNVLAFKFTDNITPKDYINLDFLIGYLNRYAPNKSLDYIIREKHGLTYNVSLYQDFGSSLNESIVYLVCGVTKGDEDKLIDLFKETLNLNNREFNFEDYRKYLKSKELKSIIGKLDQEYYDIYHDYPFYDTSLFKDNEELFAQDLDTVDLKLMEKYVDEDSVRSVLNKICSLINKQSYSLIQSIDVKE